MAKSIRQSVTINASPKAVYDALVDSTKHSLFSGSKASISRRVGGTFTAYDGYAEGVNLELVPGKKIVQSWRASDWPDGHYSKATFAISKVECVPFLVEIWEQPPALITPPSPPLPA